MQEMNNADENMYYCNMILFILEFQSWWMVWGWNKRKMESQWPAKWKIHLRNSCWTEHFMPWIQHIHSGKAVSSLYASWINQQERRKYCCCLCNTKFEKL